MSIFAETKALRRELRALAAKPEWDLLARHDLLSNKPLSSSRQRAWRYVKRTLAALGLMLPHVTDYPWRPTLKHALANADARPLLVWALGAERDELRRACEGFSNRLRDGRLAPILVTDVPDFAFFSRLGWLVEYLPELSGEGPSYRERKRAYLAWRYRDAYALPLSVGLASDREWDAVLELKRESA
jgi:hypothetical protein